MSFTRQEIENLQALVRGIPDALDHVTRLPPDQYRELVEAAAAVSEERREQ